MQRFFSAALQNRDLTKRRRPLRPLLCSAPRREERPAALRPGHETVGWVQPFAKPITTRSRVMGFASLYPTYRPGRGRLTLVLVCVGITRRPDAARVAMIRLGGAPLSAFLRTCVN